MENSDLKSYSRGCEAHCHSKAGIELLILSKIHKETEGWYWEESEESNMRQNQE